MIKLNDRQPLLSEAWQDLGTHNQLLVTVVEAIAWASYKKHDEEIEIQKVDYSNWKYVDIARSKITEELAMLMNNYSILCTAEVNEHFVRIKYEDN